MVKKCIQKVDVCDESLSCIIMFRQYTGDAPSHRQIRRPLRLQPLGPLTPRLALVAHRRQNRCIVTATLVRSVASKFADLSSSTLEVKVEVVACDSGILLS